jgi:type VI secretion system secreted protein Hcp
VAVDYFLKLDTIPGGSTDAAHKDEIQLDGFSWGATNAARAGAGAGVGAGKVQLSDLSVTMAASVASPKLFVACASGTHLKSATLSARRRGEKPHDFLVLKFTDVVVTSYQAAGSAGGDTLVDGATLGYAKVEVEFRPQKPDGSPGAAVKGGWDVAKNKPA